MNESICFYSDCVFFGGSENMLVNFLQNSIISDNFEVNFVYRFSTEYNSGYKKRILNPPRSFPVKLWGISSIIHRTNSRRGRKFFSLIYNLFLLKYLFLIRNIVVIYRLFKRVNLTILHINNGGYPGAYSCMAAVFAAKLAGVKKIVYVVNNMAISYKHPSRWLDFLFDKVVVKLVSMFVTGSARANKRLQKVLKIPPRKLAVIHNGVILRPLTETKTQVLARLRIQIDRPIIVVVAILELRKGHIYLLKALLELKRRADVALPLLLIEGTGTQQSVLREFVTNNGLGNDVIFVGTEAKVFNLMNIADIIALPSISNEDFPNVVLEAMALGKCVVASDLAGIPEQIVHKQGGILVEPGNSTDLADAIAYLLKDPKLRKKLGQMAQQNFNENFTVTRALMAYLQLYKKLLAEE